MSLDPRHLACGGVIVFNKFLFRIDDSRGGSYEYTVEMLCQRCVSICILGCFMQVLIGMTGKVKRVLQQ